MSGPENPDQSFDTWTKGWNEDGTLKKDTEWKGKKGNAKKKDTEWKGNAKK